MNELDVWLGKPVNLRCQPLQGGVICCQTNESRKPGLRIFMNSTFVDIYRPIAILMIAAIGFAVAPLAMAWLWAKRFSLHKPGPVKNSTYECGLECEG